MIVCQRDLVVQVRHLLRVTVREIERRQDELYSAVVSGQPDNQLAMVSGHTGESETIVLVVFDLD